MTVFKLIKSKAWEASSGNKGTSITVALNGRVFNMELTDFKPEDIKLDDIKKTCTTTCKFDILKEAYEADMGEKRIGLKLKPRFEFGNDFEMSQF